MKDREPRARNNVNAAAKIAVGVAIIFSGAMALRQDQAESKTPTKWEPYNGPLSPVVLPQIPDDARIGTNAKNYVSTQDERIQENRDNSPGKRAIVVFQSSQESPLAPSSPPKRALTLTSEHKKSKAPDSPANVSQSGWTLDPEISFYGPGFYGKRTACGLELTKGLKGVANRTLPCGTPVTFNWEGMTLTFPVVDRGPYVPGRIFDLTGGACMAFKSPDHLRGHCFTGPINYRIGK